MVVDKSTGRGTEMSTVSNEEKYLGQARSPKTPPPITPQLVPPIAPAPPLISGKKCFLQGCGIALVIGFVVLVSSPNGAGPQARVGDAFMLVGVFSLFGYLAVAAYRGRKGSAFKNVSFWLTVIAVGLMISQAFDLHGHFGFPKNTDPFGVGVVTLVVYWASVATFFYVRLVCRATDAAVAPIPSLAEIELQLRAEGYSPSIADVVAIEQHLKSQRNEAALTAAALVIGPQLLAKQAKGQPLL
jgi:drug/metabolite transporter (DMT)-like permease